MYIFNPEHDLCLANGDIHYVPPESALAFGRDCAGITKFMQGLNSEADNMKKIVPWGWNKVLCNRLLNQGYDEKMLPADMQLQNIAELSHRRTALQAHEFIYRKLQNMIVPPQYRIAAESVEEVENFLHRYGNVVLKAPLSGSGKGIRFAAHRLSHSDAGWCRNLITRHDCVIVEQRFLPVLECAMLFSVEDCVKFLGYSLFYSRNGAYMGNILASNGFIEQRIAEYIPYSVLETVKEGLMEFFKCTLVGKYEGFVGTDQFVCRKFLPEDTNAGYMFIPVVEINLRMTMGLVARNIYDNFGHGLGLSEGSHRFEIHWDRSMKKFRYEVSSF